MTQSSLRRFLVLASIASSTGFAWGLEPALAQSIQNVEIKASLADRGSPPYRNAVQAFLDRTMPKIVGGAPAPQGAYPWQVSLGVSWIVDPYNAHFCGGAIYDQNWIITAAHCVVTNIPSDVSVTAGVNKLKSDAPRFNVERIIVKSDFEYKPGYLAPFNNDIALIKLMDPLPLSSHIKTIPLLLPAEEGAVLTDGAILDVVGWGAIQEMGKSVRDLRFVQVPFLPRDLCNEPLRYNGTVAVNMICAGKLSGGKDSCQGDSGGPLTARTAAAPVLAGVVSWGEGCARPNKVGVYTQVSKFSGWAKSCVANPTGCR